MNKELVLFGGSFNPPTVSHVQIVQLLAERYPRVFVIPCSTHPFKQQTGAANPRLRMEMSELAFGALGPNIVLDLSDFDRQEARRTFERQAQYENQGEVWHAVGSDLIVGAHEGRAQIQQWAQGPLIWQHYRWQVIERPGFICPPCDLPPNNRVLTETAPSYSSTQVRERMKEGAPITGLVPEAVGELIMKHGLYCS
jgi:nicotinate-nucleotide adenylyltransferase